MFIGYALALPHDQNLQLQKDILTKAGCSKIYTSSAPDAATQRKELEKVLALLRPGDTLVVWNLDRLGTSIKDLTATMLFLAEQGIGFQSLTDAIDTDYQRRNAGLPDLSGVTIRDARKNENRTTDSKSERQKGRQTQTPRPCRNTGTLCAV
jgi:hypothetical protein